MVRAYVCVTIQSRRWWSSVRSAMSTRCSTAGVAAFSTLPDRVPDIRDISSSSPTVRLRTDTPHVEVNLRRPLQLYFRVVSSTFQQQQRVA